MRSRLLPTRPREGADDGVDCVAGALWPTAISTEPRCTQLIPSSAERARRERRHPKASTAKKSLALSFALEVVAPGQGSGREALAGERSLACGQSLESGTTGFDFPSQIDYLRRSGRGGPMVVKDCTCCNSATPPSRRLRNSQTSKRGRPSEGGRTMLVGVPSGEPTDTS
jgi:hypothetical protein